MNNTSGKQFDHRGWEIPYECVRDLCPYVTDDHEDFIGHLRTHITTPEEGYVMKKKGLEDYGRV